MDQLRRHICLILESNAESHIKSDILSSMRERLNNAFPMEGFRCATYPQRSQVIMLFPLNYFVEPNEVASVLCEGQYPLQPCGYKNFVVIKDAVQHQYLMIKVKTV